MIARLLISSNLETRLKKIEETIFEARLTPDHPDLLYFPFNSKLGIEQAKQIKEHFFLKPYKLKGKVVILEDASSLTIEAQNALLKTLEEPPESALLILGAPSEDQLLPTVLSRCQIVILDAAKPLIESKSGKDSINPSGLQNDIENILASTLEERFEYIANLKEKEEFLHYLVECFRAQLLQLSPDRSINNTHEGSLLTRLEVQNFLKELLLAEEWAAQNVNIRAILEYLMLVMPKNP